MSLPSARIVELAKSAGFDLVGFAQAEPIPDEVLKPWLAAGHHADMDWMEKHAELRLDVTKLFPGARTVVALACNYWHSDEPSIVARYARGRDYHATLRDRMRALRRSIREAFPEVHDYGSVDANPVMEKVWAARAGLGTVTKNGLLTTPQFGSYVLLAALILDQDVDVDVDGAGVASSAAVDVDPCGRCRICIDACPTAAFVADRVVDSTACLSYQTIENSGSMPESQREALQGFLFGCDICQDVCPLNMTPVKAGPRFAPRMVSTLSLRVLAAMSRENYAVWVPGSAMARAGYDGLRRNAAYALGAIRDVGAREILEGLTRDASSTVAEAASWALARIA